MWAARGEARGVASGARRALLVRKMTHRRLLLALLGRRLLAHHQKGKRCVSRGLWGCKLTQQIHTEGDPAQAVAIARGTCARPPDEGLMKDEESETRPLKL
jgi:hypothetical protein